MDRHRALAFVVLTHALLLALVTAIMFLVIVPLPSHAQGPEEDGPSISLSPSDGRVGDIIQVSGSGFSSNDTDCSISSSPGGLMSKWQCVVSGDGSLSGFFAVAYVSCGSYTVTVTGTVTDTIRDVASASFDVLPPPTLTLTQTVTTTGWSWRATVTTVTTTSVATRPPTPDVSYIVLGGVAGAGAVGAAMTVYSVGRNAVIRKLEETVKGYEESSRGRAPQDLDSQRRLEETERSIGAYEESSRENLLQDLENQVRPRSLSLDDVKRVADAIKDSREVIGDIKSLYQDAKTEMDRMKITEEAVRRIKRNVDQVDAFLSLLTSVQNSLIRNVPLSEEQLLMASREMRRTQNDLVEIEDALADLNRWLESSFVRLAKFGLVADGYKDLALNVGFAVDELKKPTVYGMTDVIEKISAARDIISDQLRKISRTAFESAPATTPVPPPPSAPEDTKFCLGCGTRISASEKFCHACGIKQT